jgi:hypothetical protein
VNQSRSRQKRSFGISRKLWFLILYGFGLAPTLYSCLITLAYFTQPCPTCAGGRKDLSYLVVPIRTVLPFLCGIGVAHASKKRDRP